MDSAKELDGKLEQVSSQGIGLKGHIEQARFGLRLQSERVRTMSAKLQQKDQELLQRYVRAQASLDLSHARLYANECAEVRKIAHLVLSSQLALEKVMLKLDTILESDEPISVMRSIIEVVQVIKGRIAGVVPEVAFELGQISDYLGSETAGDEANRLLEDHDEAKRILEESSAGSAERLAKEFRKLPNLDVPQVTDSVQIVEERAERVLNREAESAYGDAVFRLGRVENKLAGMLEGVYSKGRELSQRYDENRQANDYALAKIFANEYSSVRKVTRELLVVQLTLQQLALRMDSIHSYSGAISLLRDPALRVILETLADRVSPYAPLIGQELIQVIKTLDDEHFKAGEIRQQLFDAENLSDIHRAMDEAKILTDHRLSQKFPQLTSLPQELTTSCYYVLKTLRAKGGTMRMRELHDGIRELEEVDYDKSTLSDAVSRLSRLGLLTKLKDSEGGRRSKLIVSLNKPLPDWIADKLAKYVE